MKRRLLVILALFALSIGLIVLVNETSSQPKKQSPESQLPGDEYPIGCHCLAYAFPFSFVGIHAKKEWLNSSNPYIGTVQISVSIWQICSGLLMLNSIFGYF